MPLWHRVRGASSSENWETFTMLACQEIDGKISLFLVFSKFDACVICAYALF